MVNAALPFEFCQNKIALVEKENSQDYVAMQYLVENKWNLIVNQCQSDQAEDKWELKRKIPNGQTINLIGERIVYHEKNAKNPKCA